MAIDTRATVTCSLGTLISGSLSDEYVQGTGLVRCTGSVELSGVYTPALGTEVTFTYTVGATTTTIPRKLRVLSSFADPFRRTTRVELGCLLTYLAEKKPPVNWDAFDDPENAALTEDDAAIITIPIYASSVMDECLTQLGITASSNPLTNSFSIPEFDFSAGYVSVLSDLLLSESYFGYLDEDEVLQVVQLDVDGGTGPVLDKAHIIDLGPIGAGQLPGESVTVSYSSLKLSDPTDKGQVPLTDTVVSSGRSTATIAWSDPATGEPQSRGYAILTTTTTTTFYRELIVEERDPTTGTTTTSRKNVVARRQTTYGISSVAILGSFFSQCFSTGNTGGLFINYPEYTYTTETFNYDARGEETRRESATYGSMPHASGQVGLPLVFDDGTRVNVQAPGRYLLSRQVVQTIRNGERVRTITQEFGPWIKTIAGQQAIAEARDAFTTASEVQGYLNAAIAGDFLISTTVEDSTTTYKGQQAPSSAERTNAANADASGDPNNGYRTSSVADLELALGSAAAQRRIEFSLPYAPDDIFIKDGSTYRAVPSDAAAKARRFGRVQNRILLGNRSGMSIQTAAGRLPSTPYAPFVVQANGLSALYRTNGMTWTLGPEGIVVSTDAIFWGAVGGTGTFWFPVAPGITTLPTTPAITGGSALVPGAITVGTTVPPWNETVALQGRLRLRTRVEGLPYALTLPDVEVEGRVRLRGSVARLVTVDLPLTTLSLSAPEPLVYSPAIVNLPASTLSLGAMAPEVGQVGVAVTLPLTALSLSAPAPEILGSAVVQLPLSTLSLTAPVPTVTGTDADALTYINAVETADGQALENGVRAAIDALVKGCKTDGTWDAIKAACILAGARTLTGALVPLKGTAPTNNGFVSGDYNRKTGLLGNGSSKWLNSNRNNNADPQDNKHLAVYISVAASGTGSQVFIGSDSTATPGASLIYKAGSADGSTDKYVAHINQDAGPVPEGSGANSGFSTGLMGASRTSSSTLTGRVAGASASYTQTSETPSASSVVVFARTASSPARFTNARLSFYSIGEAVDLALLETRLATLMSDLAAAIP